MTVTFSTLGLGCGPLGESHLSDSEAERLVRGALDRGVTVFDTARSYGASEERLGRALRGRRQEAVLITKGGYGVAGVADWTGECIRRGVDEALVRLGVEQIDAFLLHSCDLPTLERGEVVAALGRARELGKIRMAGYSGEGAALSWAAERRDTFSVLECSLSPFDQRNLERLEHLRREDFCVLVKRPLGNAPWRYAERPTRDDVAVYWDRMRAMAVDPIRLLGGDAPRSIDAAWLELGLRFSAREPGVTSALLGTSSLAHLDEALAAVARGPLPPESDKALRAAFAAHGEAWDARI